MTCEDFARILTSYRMVAWGFALAHVGDDSGN